MSEEFEQFATDHSLHVHCVACGGCIFDRRVQLLVPVWCVGCRDKLKAASKTTGVPLPWDPRQEIGA